MPHFAYASFAMTDEIIALAVTDVFAPSETVDEIGFLTYIAFSFKFFIEYFTLSRRVNTLVAFIYSI